MRFFPGFSATNERSPWAENKLSHIITMLTRRGKNFSWSWYLMSVFLFFSWFIWFCTRFLASSQPPSDAFSPRPLWKPFTFPGELHQVALCYTMPCYAMLLNKLSKLILSNWYCNRSQMTSQRVKNNEGRHESGVTVVLYKLWRLLWSITYTHKRENVIYLFYTIKMQIVYWRIFGGIKKEKQVRWCDLTWIWPHLCVSFNRSR